MDQLPRENRHQMHGSKKTEMEYCLAIFQQLESALQEDELLEQMLAQDQMDSHNSSILSGVSEELDGLDNSSSPQNRSPQGSYNPKATKFMESITLENVEDQKNINSKSANQKIQYPQTLINDTSQSRSKESRSKGQNSDRIIKTTDILNEESGSVQTKRQHQVNPLITNKIIMEQEHDEDMSSQGYSNRVVSAANVNKKTSDLINIQESNHHREESLKGKTQGGSPMQNINPQQLDETDQNMIDSEILKLQKAMSGFTDLSRDEKDDSDTMQMTTMGAFYKEKKNSERSHSLSSSQRHVQTFALNKNSKENQITVTEESSNSNKKYAIVTPRKPGELRATKQTTNKTSQKMRDSQYVKSSVYSSYKQSQQNSCSSPERTGRFASMSDEEYQQFENERKATFHQKRVVMKQPLNVNQNDKEVLETLKEKLVELMHMDPKDQLKMLQQSRLNTDPSVHNHNSQSSLSKSREALASPMSGSTKKLTFKMSNRDQQLNSPISLGNQKDKIMIEDEQYGSQAKSRWASIFSKTSTISPHNQSTIPQIDLSLLANLNADNYDNRKLNITKKLDNLLDQNKQKEETLKQLQHQLKGMRQANQKEQETLVKVQESVRKNDDILNSPDRIYQGTVAERLMDVKAMKETFDFANIESIIKMKETLRSKISLVERRQRENERENFTYLEMLHKQEKKTENDRVIEQDIQQKHADMNMIVQDLQNIEVIQNNRVIELDNLQYEYHKKINKDNEKMQQVLTEKQIVLKNHEHDVQSILFRMLTHLREIKRLRNRLTHYDQMKEQNRDKELDILAAYQYRMSQIEMLHDLSLLNQIKQYSEKLDSVDHNEQLSDDQIRIRGLQLIQDMKENIVNARTPPNFEIDAQDQASGFSQQKALSSNSQETVYSDPKVQIQKMSRDDQKQLQKSVETYIKYKQHYDQYYQEYMHSVSRVDINFIIEQYNMSTIKLNSLQQAHKTQEVEKQGRMMELAQQQEASMFLRQEDQLIGQYIKNLDIGDELHIREPLSLEGMQIFMEELNQKIRCTQRYIKTQEDVIGEFSYGYQEQMKGLVIKMEIFKRHSVFKGQPVKLGNLPDIMDLVQILDRYKLRPREEKLKNMMATKTMRKPMKKGSLARNVGGRKSSRNASNISNKNAEKLSNKLNITGGGQGSSSNEKNSFILGTGNNSGITKNRQIQDNTPIIVNESSTNEDENEMLNLNNSNNMSNRSENQSPVVGMKLANQSNSDNILMQKKYNQNMRKQGKGSSAQIFVRMSNDMLNMQIHRDMKVIIKHLRELEDIGRKTKFQHQSTVKQFGKRDKQSGSRVLSQDGNILNIDDFDPVYRVKDFAQVKKNVINMMELNRKYGAAQYKELRDTVKRKMDTQITIDPEDKEFRESDPRRVTIDRNQQIKDALLNKLQRNQKYSVAERLWKTEKNQNESYKHELQKQRQNLKNITKQEKDFIEELKENIGQRYNKLRHSFEREYESNSKPMDAGQAFMSDIPNQYDYPISNSKSVSSRYFPTTHSTIQPGSRNKVNSQVFGSSKASNVMISAKSPEDDHEFFKPLKSPCFDMEKKKPFTASSLKERIKLNKLLTQSPKTGLLIGVNPYRKNKMEGFTDQIVLPQNLKNQVQMPNSVRNNAGQRRQNSILEPNIATSYRQTSGAFTTNMAFNLTYQTLQYNKENIGKKGSMSGGGSPSQAKEWDNYDPQNNAGMITLKSHKQNNLASLYNTQMENQVEIFNKYYKNTRGSMANLNHRNQRLSQVQSKNVFTHRSNQARSKVNTMASQMMLKQSGYRSRGKQSGLMTANSSLHESNTYAVTSQPALIGGTGSNSQSDTNLHVPPINEKKRLQTAALNRRQNKQI